MVFREFSQRERGFLSGAGHQAVQRALHYRLVWAPPLPFDVAGVALNDIQHDLGTQCDCRLPGNGDADVQILIVAAGVQAQYDPPRRMPAVTFWDHMGFHGNAYRVDKAKLLILARTYLYPFRKSMTDHFTGCFR